MKFDFAFGMERERPVLWRIAIVSLVAHLSLGYAVATHEIVSLVSPGVWGLGERAPLAIRLAEEIPPSLARFRAAPLPANRAGTGPVRPSDADQDLPEGRRSGGGGGDPLARVTRMGVLGHMDGSRDGSRVSSIEGGVVDASDGIAQLLRGVGATRRSSGITGRGEPGIGFGEGTGSGFGGGAATMRAEDLVLSFGDGGGTEIVLQKKGALAGSGELPYLESGGCREEAEIARIVQSHRGAIRGCYNRSLLGKPDEEGEIGVRFVIDTAGRVVAADILSRTFRDPEMEACILERMREWTFPPEEGCETVVRYAFHFSSGL